MIHPKNGGLVGKTISHYKILEKLGEGGMGEVYLAHDTDLDRKVALKLLPSHYTKDREVKVRFKREAKAAAKLNHPNIITVYEIGDHENQSYIAMEYIKGRSLREEIQKGPLPVDSVRDIGTQLCEGLDKAHKAEIVHRDIKPENILIDDEDRIKIVDFGVAQVRTATRLTRESSTIGTMKYMSPEQYKGEKVNHRTDIWSLGVMLYEMLTGQVPFKGDYEASVMYSILNDVLVPVAAIRNDIPAEFERIVTKCLQKNPSARYQDVTKLLADLRQIGKSKAKTRLTKTVYSHSRKFWLLAASLVFIAAITILYFTGVFHLRSRNVTNGKPMLAVLTFENLGPMDDEYFADGLTVEMTAKLGKLQQLRVIGEQSAAKYKNSDKSDTKIGSELGADFILRSTIMWQRKQDEQSRVRFVPRLIRTSDGVQIWTDAYTATITDVFEVQAEIAEKVVSKLGMALQTIESETHSERPTKVAEAYEFYLRGLSYSNRPLRRIEDEQLAIEMLEKTIALDPNYMVAYAALSRSYSNLFSDYSNKEAASKSKLAANKAASLAPEHPESHWALGRYYFLVEDDLEKAEKYFDIACSKLPNNAVLLAEMGYVQRYRGKWEQAVLSTREAVNLDPHAYYPLESLARTYGLTRKYEEAEQVLNRCVTLFPDSPWPHFLKVLHFLAWDGNTRRAQKALRDASSRTDLMRFLLVNWDFDDSMVLRIFVEQFEDELQQRTLKDPADRATFYLEKGEAGLRSGKESVARAFYDSARVILEKRLPVPVPSFYNSREYYRLGLAYARLGRKAEAIKMGIQSVQLYPLEKYSYSASYAIPTLAEIYTLTGEYEAAINQLEIMLSVPSIFSIPLIKLDPIWDPLRQHPRFQKLIERGG